MIEPMELTGLTILPALLDPSVVFGNGGVSAVLDDITARVRAIDTDISTLDGRKAVASLAFKIARSKTALDSMGANLVADWKAQAKVVDLDRRRIRDTLDELKAEVRQPLTEWELTDARRIMAHEQVLAEIIALSTFPQPEPSTSAIKARLGSLLGDEATDWRDWQEFTKRATDARAVAICDLRALLLATETREAERAELARLRAEQVARKQRERDDNLRAEAAETARLEAEAKAALATGLLAEQMERERSRLVRLQRAAETAQLAAQADAAFAVAAERKQVKDVADNVAAETAKRETDKAHRATIYSEIRAALEMLGITPHAAFEAVNAIAAGKVPHVKIEY